MPTTYSTSDLLVQGDISTALTYSVISSALGDKPTFEKAGTATLVSIVSRLLSKQFPDAVRANGAITNDETSSMLVVGIVNAFVAWGMKRNVGKTVAIGIAADVTGDRLLTMLSFEPNKPIFGSKTDPEAQ